MIFESLNVDPAWLGTAISSIIAGLYARRANIRSKTVQDELQGPGEEPSIRKIVIDSRIKIAEHHVEVLEKFLELHSDAKLTVERLTMMETLQKKLEFDMERVRFHIHYFANTMQLKIFTEEEIRKVLEDRKKAAVDDDSSI